MSWSGQDDPGGSGIASYDVYVSDNGGPFTLWQSWTTHTSAIFTGQCRPHLRLLQRRHRQRRQPASDTNCCPGNHASRQQHADQLGGPIAGMLASSFTVSWSGTDYPGGSGIATYDVYVSDNGGAFTLFVTATTTTSTTYHGTAGHTYGFYSVATDKLGFTQPTPAPPRRRRRLRIFLHRRRLLRHLPPPLVTVSKVLLTLNKKHQVTRITVDMSGPFACRRRRLARGLPLTTAGKRGSFTAKNAKPVKLKSAVYSASSSNPSRSHRRSRSP